MPKKPIELVWADIAELWLDVQPQFARIEEFSAR